MYLVKTPSGPFLWLNVIFIIKNNRHFFISLVWDLYQNPDAWHTHSVALQPRPNGFNFYLTGEDLGTTQAGISIKGNELKLSTPLAQSGVIGDDLAAATSFTIWDPSVTNGGCADGELLVRANGIVRGTAVPITG